MSVHNRSRRSPAALLAVVLAGVALLAALPSAEAHGKRRWRGDVDVHIGIPFWGYWGPRWYAPPPVVYAPPPAVYPRVYSPPVYVERDDDYDDRGPADAPPAQAWWYWCPSARGYHPYVKECPDGWQRVPPQPVPAPRND